MAEERKAYREERIKPPVWDPAKQAYHDWRFLVVLWSKACDKAKLSKSDRGYNLFTSLKDIQKDNIGAKLVDAAQLDEIEVFGDECVEQILAVLDKRFQRDKMAMKKKAWHSYVHLKRSKDQSIDQYIDCYDRACAELRKAGSDLGDEIGALQLMTKLVTL